jgi:hypothetical protein
VIVQSIAPQLRANALEPIPACSRACARLVCSCVRADLSDRPQCACAIDRTSVAIERTCTNYISMCLRVCDLSVLRSSVSLLTAPIDPRRCMCFNFHFFLLFYLIISFSLIIFFILPIFIYLFAVFSFS